MILPHEATAGNAALPDPSPDPDLARERAAILACLRRRRARCRGLEPAGNWHRLGAAAIPRGAVAVDPGEGATEVERRKGC